MPELPEVETTRRGIAPALQGREIRALIVRERRLRWPVPPGLEARLRGQPILRLNRRAKYLLLETPAGTALLHLGMSGSLRIIADDAPPAKHDHFDIITDQDEIVRFNDPRRFGSLLWAGQRPDEHPLLARLGPEPLSNDFSGTTLWETGRNRRISIKQHIMNSRVVVGVGNIYASEALFRAGIHPLRQAGRISRARLDTLAEAIKAVLRDAIRAGGTTLRDYRGGDGKPGYFRQQLSVYEREGQTCKTCNGQVRQIRIGQRSTYYCPQCQR